MYYASVDKREDGIYTSSSRSVGIVGFGDSIQEAEKISETAISSVESDKLFYRKDIGKPELIQKRIDHMNQLRSQ